MAEDSAFGRLGLPVVLMLAEDQIKSSFQQLSKSLHPDHGGDAESFAKLNNAYQVLDHTSSRLKEWMRMHQLPIEERGAIEGDLISEFSSVAEIISKADALIGKRSQAATVLVKAMLEKQSFTMRDELEKKMDSLTTLMQNLIGENFARLDESPDERLANQVLRSLVFIEKWVSQLRDRFAQLW